MRVDTASLGRYRRPPPVATSLCRDSGPPLRLLGSIISRNAVLGTGQAVKPLGRIGHLSAFFLANLLGVAEVEVIKTSHHLRKAIVRTGDGSYSCQLGGGSATDLACCSGISASLAQFRGRVPPFQKRSRKRRHGCCQDADGPQRLWLRIVAPRGPECVVTHLLATGPRRLGGLESVGLAHPSVVMVP